MKIFVTGGSGFVGSEVIRQLLEAHHQVRVLTHRAEKDLPTEVETVPGDTTDPQSLAGRLAGCDAVIHLVGIIREFPSRGITFDRLHRESTSNMVTAAKEQGVKRFLHMSANGVREDAATDYHKTKWQAENLLRSSPLDWTIFRPSLIFGANDQFVNMLAQLIRNLPVVPVMGDGSYRLQPVSVKDVVSGFVAALDAPQSIGQIYLCGGPQTFSYNEILDEIGAALGKSKVHKLHHPLWLMQPVIAVMQSIPQFPMTSDQLQMLLEENICDPEPWKQAFDLTLTPFSEGISSYLG